MKWKDIRNLTRVEIERLYRKRIITWHQYERYCYDPQNSTKERWTDKVSQGEEGRCPHGMFMSGAGGCPECAS